MRGMGSAARCRMLCSASVPSTRPLRDGLAGTPEEEFELRQEIWEKIAEAYPEPKFRSPPPLPPTTHMETWANRKYVSRDVIENALSFCTRFYIGADTGPGFGQPDYARDVQMVVDVAKLGLNEAERNRLLAVAAPHLNRKRRELHFRCSLHPEAGRNKAILRHKFAALLQDARENADAHATTPQAKLPLASRRRPWWPGDKRAYKGKHKRYKLNSGSPG